MRDVLYTTYVCTLASLAPVPSQVYSYQPPNERSGNLSIINQRIHHSSIETLDYSSAHTTASPLNIVFGGVNNFVLLLYHQSIIEIRVPHTNMK